MPPARRDELLALAAALVTVVFWASAFVGIRDSGRDLSPGALALARLVVGSVVLGAFVLVLRERLPGRRDSCSAAMLVNVGPIPSSSSPG